MPTYAYACTQCGHQFDAVQSFSDAALTTCPECGGALRKQYGSIGVTFNGSGFYRTDSRSGSGSTSGSQASSKAGSSTSANPAPASSPASA
ncbi:FmdB family zinc ribbon protein [Microbacterium sp. NPDC055903]